MNTSKPDLKGKGAIITGGGSGINLAFVKSLFEAGCNILICDLSLHRECVAWMDHLPKSATDPHAKAPGQPRLVFQKTDVSDWRQLENLFDVYEKEFGGCPYLVCPGAGVYEPSVNNFWNDRDTASYKILDINLSHPIKLSRLAIRAMLRTRTPGTIILVSSTGAQKSSIITPLYQAAKHGISNFIRCMAPLQQYGDIRVVGVAPGPTMSPLMYDHPEALRFVDPERDALATPEQVAEGMMAVCFGKDRFAPGTVLEVTSLGWREVRLLMDPGPQGKAGWTSKKDEAIQDLVISVIESEKGKGKL